MNSMPEELLAAVTALEAERERVLELVLDHLKSLQCETTAAEQLASRLDSSPIRKSAAPKRTPKVTKSMILELLQPKLADNPSTSKETLWKFVSEKLSTKGLDPDRAKTVFSKAFSDLKAKQSLRTANA